MVTHGCRHRRRTKELAAFIEFANDGADREAAIERLAKPANDSGKPGRYTRGLELNSSAAWHCSSWHRFDSIRYSSNRHTEAHSIKVPENRANSLVPPIQWHTNGCALCRLVPSCAPEFDRSQ